MADEPIDDVFDDEEYECWCGARGTYAELCDPDFLDETCGGMGTLNSACCHHHGEIECPGCKDCEDGFLGDFDYGD